MNWQLRSRDASEPRSDEIRPSRTPETQIRNRRLPAVSRSLRRSDGDGGGIRCFQCGEYNGQNAHFCSACGRDFSSRCSGCKSLIYISENFCRACGEPITRASSKAYLIGLRGGYSGTRIELGADDLRFGRHQDNDVSFAGLDKYVSRFQSRMKFIRHQYWIESGYAAGGNTTNGTFVNGCNIDGKGLVLLKGGDKVRMGDSFFRFVA